MNTAIFWLIASLVGVDFFGYGLTLGFLAAMGVVVLLVVAGWLFYRVSRPRVQFGAWQRVDNLVFRMEVA